MMSIQFLGAAAQAKMTKIAQMQAAVSEAENASAGASPAPGAAFPGTCFYVDMHTCVSNCKEHLAMSVAEAKCF